MAQETLKVTILGQSIIDAVQKIAKNPVIEKSVLDGATAYRLGQTSLWSCGHLAVTGNGESLIDPAKTYQSVTVAEHNWGGMVYATPDNQKAADEAVRDFAKKLKAELEKYALPDEAMVQFEFEGEKYQYPQNTNDPHQDIVLPDGKILAVTQWEGDQPVDYSVVKLYHVAQKI